MDEIEDVIELGIEGIDTMIDKHWDKLPSGAFLAHNYNPRKLRKSSRRSSSMNPPYPEDTVVVPKNKSKKNRRNEAPRDRAGNGDGERGFVEPPDSPEGSYIPYTAPVPPIFSNEPPRSRQQYTPQAYGPSENHATQEDYGPRSGAIMTRRGISQPDLFRGRDRDREYYSSEEYSPSPNRRVQRRRDPNDLKSSTNMDKSRDKPAKHGVDLTGSSEGLLGAGVGAILGGFAAAKAQDYTSGGKKKKKNDDLLTLLGAAVGGLAVNAAVDRWEDGKKERTRSSRDRDRDRDRGSDRGR